MSHTVTSAWTDKAAPCQSRVAPNCLGAAGPVSGTVDRAPACHPCMRHAKNANSAADRRRG
jgi:hypothetical protein